MKKQVLCFGEVLWDTFGDEQKPGGAPMNVALHLVKQGINASLLSRIGNDKPGRELGQFLKTNNLYSDLLQVDEKLPTCKVAVQLDKQQQATYTIPKPVSWDNIQHNETLQARIKTISVIVFGSLACRTAASRNTLLNLFENKMLKVFDVNLRHPHYEKSTIETLAAMADVIKMNEEEANLLIGNYDEPLKDKITEFRKKYHSKTICVTRGENGAIVYHDDKFYEHPGFMVEVVDTVGAGDSFLATFIAGLLNKQPMDEVLEKACAIGAFVASQRGANPVYDQAKINEIIANGELAI
ncbi:carbohydrate kinase [Mucilaginibacter sp. HMF5004]|uniref:carbohydrate kinase family protein n=1 Tax=Mucilaginibacter rivuli TaxID=2857527 RepID=UPI001C5DCCFD|nr:carbohydrate kinase [Mucilaginibacter rivuli]MBW4890258.1 carbohydrate kinase [Mucilaginibacter rivuli]